MALVRRSTWFITGTDTGVGKTLLACWLIRHLRDAGVAVAPLKPVCSGGRGDAQRVREASGGALTLDEINPWHFRAPLAPALAAQREQQGVRRTQALARVRRMQRRFQVVLIEGAGGLLSPLGKDFDSRDLIVALRATPLVVCPNRLGAINQCLLVLDALPRGLSRQAQVVLMSPRHPCAASRSNPQLLGELIGAGRVHVLPWLKFPKTNHPLPAHPRLHAALKRLLEALGQEVPERIRTLR